MKWKPFLIIISALFSLANGSCDPICASELYCHETECIELPKLSTPPEVLKTTCGILSVRWRGWTSKKDTGDSRISHYILLSSTEADPDKWEAFSRYNHYVEDQSFVEVFSIPQGSPRRHRYRVDVYIAINNTVINAFTPGFPSEFYSADCTDCPEGLYGANCSDSCNCRDNATCEAVNGACRNGCLYGFTGLSCAIVLPTLILPPQTYTGEECGTAVISWRPGNYSELDAKIKVHAYQIDFKKANETKWSTKYDLFKHNDSSRIFVDNIINLQIGFEYYFRVNIRVSEYEEILPDYTYGPISDPVLIQCRTTNWNEISASQTSSFRPTSLAPTYRTSTQILSDSQITTKTLYTIKTPQTLPGSETTTQTLSTRETTQISSSSETSTPTFPFSTSTMTTITTNTTDHSTRVDGGPLSEELDLMIQNLSLTINISAHILIITWRLDERYTYLMKSGTLFFGLVGVGNCYNNTDIDWIPYPLTMDLREVRIPHWDGWRTYKIRIEYQQYSSNGHSPSAVLDYSTPKKVPSSSARDVRITSITSNSVQVRWEAPMCQFLGSDVVSYTCSVLEKNTKNEIILQTKNLDIQVTSLKPFTIFSLIIIIENDIGPGPSTHPIIFRTKEYVPGPPTIIKVTPFDTAIQVIFTPPLERNGIISKYRVTIEEVGTLAPITMDSDVTTVTVKNLTAYTSYNVKVQARTSVGWGSFSTVRTLRTLEDVPGSPTEFTVTFQNETTVGIRWKSPNFTRGIIQGYKITYRQGSNSKENVLFVAFQSALIGVLITRLEPGEYYHFRVEARSGVGYGPSLNGSSFTFPAIPSKPPIPKISYINQQLTLTLNPSIVTAKHFYMVRVYVDDVNVSTLEMGNNLENTGPSGTVILILDQNDLAQTVVYILGDNTTRHGVQNIMLESYHTYNFYIEIVISFENILRSNYTKYPDSFTIVPRKSPDITAEESNESSLAGVVLGVVIVVLLIPGVASICIVLKRSKKKTETRSEYDGNETTYDWEKAMNLGGTNLMLSASLRRSLDSISGSLLGNTSLIDEPIEIEPIKRSSSCKGDMSEVEHRHRRAQRNGNIKKSLSDTAMFQKNNLHREYDNNLKTKSKSSSLQKMQNGYNDRTKTAIAVENQVANNENVTKKKVPPKPPRHRLRRSATGSNFEELKRRACSPIVEEDFDEMMKNIDKMSHQHDRVLSSYPHSEIITSVDRSRDKHSTTSDLESTNLNAMDIATQTSSERGVVKKPKMKRRRRILASKAMSENRRAPTSTVQERMQINRKPCDITGSVSTENSVEIESVSKENNYDDKKRERIKRKRALQRRAESLRNYKDNQQGYSSKSFSFNERRNFRKFSDFYLSSGSDGEMMELKSPMKSQDGSMGLTSKALRQGRIDSIEMESHTGDLERRVSNGRSVDRRRKKSHSLRETGSTTRGEYREQDILKFWSKTYSFLDERKILPHEESVEEYKVTNFYETDRPQTVSLELEFKSLPTGMLGTTNIARQKAGVPSHKLCLESYDHSRVILKPEGPDDYINASYIKDRSRDGCHRYIAAKTPNDEPSALKFWRMILQEGTRVIVKLSQQPDIFPSEIISQTGQVNDRFKLTHCEDISVHECAVRYMKIKNVLDQSTRGLYIIHDLQWPDDDRYYLPQSTKDFLSMREVVRKCQGTSLAPIVVHCGQEDGRSGVFIAIDALLLEYEKQREVNIFSFVRNMLKDRYGMIKTVWQYRFIYEALLEAHWQT